MRENINKMGLGKSIKMYLTIFIATTCIYMLIYQYHMSGNPLTQNDIIKHQEKSPSSSSASASSFVSYLWTPMSIFNSTTTTTTPQTTSSSLSSTMDHQRKLRQSNRIVNDSSIAMVSLINITDPLITSSATSSSSSSISSLSSSSSSTTTTTTMKTTARTTTSKRMEKEKENRVPTPASVTTTRAPTTTWNTEVTRTHNSRHRSAFVPVSMPPPLYIITPTYRRAEQLAELTRLGYTLKHISNLLWLVIEDANQTSPLVTQTLQRIGVPYEYLIAPMPEEYKTKRAKPRGVSNRNRGLQWLRANATEGVFYFADDDNTYDIRIFEQMRFTKKVSMWPVGLVTKTGVSSPILRDGKLDGYYDGWIGGRKYPVDMAGFAVSIKFLHERPDAKMPFKPGYEEDGFLRSLAPLNNNELEFLASDCTEILTWHTQTKKNQPAQPLNRTQYSNTNLELIDKTLVRP